MAEFLLDNLQVEALSEILTIHCPDIELLPPDGVLSFTHRLVVELVRDCLTKYHRGHLTSEYLTDLLQNIRTLLQQAEERSQYGDLAFIKEPAEKVLCVLEGPARSPERLETPEGDDKDGENVPPESPDPDTSQPGPSSDLSTETPELADPESVICEIPEIHEPVAETPEGDDKDGENVPPESPDPDTSQPGPSSDLSTETPELADPESVICEIPEIHEPDAETPEGDDKDVENVPPESPDPDTSQPGPSSDLSTETPELVDPESVICEIPEIHDPVANLMESLIPARKPQMSDYETSKLISGGCFGAVYLVRHKDSQQIFAMKKMAKKKLETPKDVEDVFLERDILTFANCPFVVSMLCSFPTISHLCMVMEYVGGGDCGSLLNRRGTLSVPLARLYFAETVLAVEYLHSYGVVHRDLKPYNLLITTAGHIKVTDFGLSKVGVMIPKTNTYKQSAEDISREFKDREKCGTVHYMAPEVILKKGYGRPVDWWSMGIILHEFLVGSVPFDGDSIPEINKKIVLGKISWNSKRSPPPDAKNLITELLRINPEHRRGTGGAFEIKDHPFVSNLDFDNLLNQKPMYIPHLVSDLDTSLFINHADIDMHMVSENEEDTSEDIKSLDFQNFTSSSERLSKICTIANSTMNNEDSKSHPECTKASSTKISAI
ncbi:microtubule-associated serine/threonine-protein kinase 4-like [Ranitomeya variabilis]|uniref:microtubule-associated serine/threonine-protein kinase 4-like n=1 Tax=Ranitomeya variabilis TaxID=490064 RepID=UPI0040577C8C